MSQYEVLTVADTRIRLRVISTPALRTTVNVSHRTASTMYQVYNARLTAGTLKQYAAAYKQFLRWSSMRGIDIERLVYNHIGDIDEILWKYLAELYNKFDTAGQSGKTSATHTLNGLLHFQPKLNKSIMKHSFGMCEGWNNMKPSKPHPPLSWDVTIALVMTMISNNYIEHAIATLLAFDCYLRISEFCNLRVKEVLLPNDARFSLSSTNVPSQQGSWRQGPRTILTLPSSKTGVNQSVGIENQQIELVFNKYIHLKQKSDYVFSFNTSSYTKVFHSLLQALQLSGIPYTPHSLRHGGSSHHYQQHGAGALEAIAFRGRWHSTESIRLYIQQSPAQMVNYDVPSTIEVISRRYTSKFVNILNQKIDQMCHSNTSLRK